MTKEEYTPEEPSLFVDNPIMNAKLEKQFKKWAEKGKKNSSRKEGAD